MARIRVGRSLPPLLAAIGLGAGMFGFVGPSGADAQAISGGAFGESVNVSFSGGGATISGPLPSVSLPPDGGSVRDTAVSVVVRAPDDAAPFGGRLLKTATLKAASDGSTGPSGSSTSLAVAADVRALGGVLTTPKVRSTCTAAEAGTGGSTTFDGGTFAVSATETVTLPSEPAPNTTLAGTLSGESYRAILNEQVVDGASITVNGVRLVLDGPSAAGEVVLAQSRCSTTAAGPASPPAPASTTPTTAPPAMSSSAPAATQSTPADGKSAPAPAGRTAAAAAPESRVGPPSLAAAAATQEVSKVVGGACAYYVDVGLFGGPKNLRGCGQPADAPAVAASPSVTLPPTGSANPITANDPDGAKAQYGPAVIFGGIWPDSAPSAPESGPLSASTKGTTGPNGSVASSTSVVLFDPPRPNAPGGAGPGPLIANEIRSTCTADADGVRGSASFVKGILETKYDRNSQAAIEKEPIPASPPVNYTREGTIDHVGDRFRIVFNEQKKAADGTLTVNAAHMYLLGPIAVGDMVVGQSRCGASLQAAGAHPTSSTTSTTAGGSTGSGSTPTSTSASGSPSSPAGGGTAAEGAAARVAGANTGRSGRGNRSAPAGGVAGMARTGLEAPLLPALFFLSTGVAARRWATRRPSAGATPDGVDRR